MNWKPILLRLAAVIAILLLLAGCSPDIDSAYGFREGLHEESVNGTGVLGTLFEQAGHQVYSRHKLTPGMRERGDVIVWFPQDFAAPSDEALVWFDDWLQGQDGRTLIVVGRDYDAAPGYWRKIQPGAPATQAAALSERLQTADRVFTAARSGIPKSEERYWYALEGKLQHRDVRSLEGQTDWLAGVDPTKLEFELNGRVLLPETPPSDDYEAPEVLLESQGDALVFRQRIGGSQVIVVANGSFLLNLPLVNHEHRKLAASLIREVGEGRQVVFLETKGNPPIAEVEEPFKIPTGLELLGVVPFNQILLHLALVGIIFCFARWPVFGRPPEDLAPGTSDFGEHITALGELLALTGNVAYAQQRLLHYQQGRLEPRNTKTDVKANSS